MARRHGPTRAALVRFALRAVPDERGEIAALPACPEPVHALIRPMSSSAPTARLRERDTWDLWRRQSEPVFLDGYEAEQAACGVWTRVVLPFSFNDHDPDACGDCVSQVAEWRADVSAWWQRRQARLVARADAQEEREEIAAWRQMEGRRRWLRDHDAD